MSICRAPLRIRLKRYKMAVGDFKWPGYF